MDNFRAEVFGRKPAEDIEPGPSNERRRNQLLDLNLDEDEPILVSLLTVFFRFHCSVSFNDDAID